MKRPPPILRLSATAAEKTLICQCIKIFNLYMHRRFIFFFLRNKSLNGAYIKQYILIDKKKYNQKMIRKNNIVFTVFKLHIKYHTVIVKYFIISLVGS